jgi:UDP-glucuronate decarboxylase
LLTEKSIYPTSKKMGEELVYNYIRNGGDGLILRLFNVYGPNMDVRNNGYGRVIPNFINAISNNQALTIYGDGNQIRSFVWIDDLIDALINLLNYDGDNKVLNVGNPTETTINDLARTLFSIFGKNTGIEYVPRDIDDPLWRRPNTTVIENSINWKPKVSLLEGLKRIIGVDYE